MRPKLRGAQLLDRLLPDVELFVLFSSTGAFLAQPGQANYAAANAGLDALATDRRARGLSGLSIEWGVWESTGLVRGTSGTQGVAEMSRMGIRAFPPARGAALFGWLCGLRAAAVAVLPIDWAVFGRTRAGEGNPLFRDLRGSASGNGVGARDLVHRLAAADLAERRKLIESVVRETVGRVLKIAPARLDARKALGTMGLNSLMAMEMRNRLESELGRPLSATLAWNYPTIDALVAHLSGMESPPADSRVAPASPPAVSDLQGRIDEVAKLSDADAARELRGSRRRAST